MVWDPRGLPDLRGRTIAITGANAGLGYFTAEQLAGTGARVVLACRNAERAERAASAIRSQVPGARVDTIPLDTADAVSVAGAAARLADEERLDALVLNAGVTSPPRTREETPEGNELVLATNLLGHFALTAGAFPALERTPGSRVVGLGSLITRLFDFRIGDLQLRAGYTPSRAYAHSKIAMQSFCFELDRRLRDARSTVSALVAHPGFSVDGLTGRVPGVLQPSVRQRILEGALRPVAQGKEVGAWPTVRAVADPDAKGGQFWGPGHVVAGRPVLQQPTATTLDPQVATELWAKCEEYTGTSFQVRSAAVA